VLETICTTCRALASDVRLAILYQLSRQQELAASKIADRVSISRGLTAHHLRRLTACALIQPRRSSRYIYYRLRTDPPAPGRFSPAPLVHRAFLHVGWATKGWREEKMIHVTSPQALLLPEDVVRMMDVVFDAATAFANVRRLQLLRFLHGHGAGSVGTLRAQLSMSPQACWRHLDKLRRRGYVRSHGRGAWSLSRKASTRFHSALFAEVTRTWEGDLTVV